MDKIVRRRRTGPGRIRIVACASVLFALGVPASAGIDQARARQYFAEAEELCRRDGGHLWGVSLCGPIVFADPTTGEIAASKAVPDEKRPQALGYANTALEWGGERWASYIWQGIPAEAPHKRKRLLMHELFHGVEPRLGLMTENGRNDHLDTLEGRYWLRLEWRALARALQAGGPERDSAARDALAFRAKRRAIFGDAAENERREEIREGLAQYTGTLLAVDAKDEAVASAVDQLSEAEAQPTFVRTFAYPSGLAYGLLLDAFSPDWRKTVEGGSDLGEMLAAASGLRASGDPEEAAARYGAGELMAAERKRDTEQKAHVAELRKRFVDGPLLVLPGGGRSAFVTTGATPIPGSGTVYTSYRVESEWGSLEATDGALVAADGGHVFLPGPVREDGKSLSGEGWTASLEPGWTIRPGPREIDRQVVRENP